MNKIHKTMIASVFTVVTLAHISVAAVVLSGTAQTDDTVLSTTQPSTNFGTDQIFTVGGAISGNMFRSLLRFDLSSLAGQTETGASLELTSSNHGNSIINQTVSLFRITPANRSWIEGTADGAQQTGSPSWSHLAEPSTNWAGSAGLSSSGVDYIATPLGSFTINSTDPLGTKYTITFSDVSFMAGWASNPSTNAGFLLKAPGLEPGSVNASFVSSEGAPSSAPALTVNTVPEPSSIALVGFGFLLFTLTTRKSSPCHNRNA